MLGVEVLCFGGREFEEVRIRFAYILGEEVAFVGPDRPVQPVCSIDALPMESIAWDISEQVSGVLQELPYFDGLDAPPGIWHAVPMIAIGSGGFS